MNIEEIMIEWNNINGLDGLEMSQMRLDGDERDERIEEKYIIRIIEIILQNLFIFTLPKNIIKQS